MTLKADVDMLAGLGQALHGLADQVGAEKVGADAGPLGSGGAELPASVRAAANVSHFLLDGDLVPAVQARLHDAGDAVIGVAAEYRDGDESHAHNLAESYRNAVGTWMGTVS